MVGPNLDRLLFGEECTACGAQRPLFNLNTSKLIDYALVYRVCRYCAIRLSDASRRHATIPDRIPFFVINAHGEETSRARRAAIESRWPRRSAAAHDDGAHAGPPADGEDDR